MGILIVENDIKWIDHLKKYVESKGYNVYYRQTPIQAYQLLEELPISGIILDLNLGLGRNLNDGFFFLDILETHKIYIPTIILSHFSDKKGIGKRCFEYPFVEDVISKSRYFEYQKKIVNFLNTSQDNKIKRIRKSVEIRRDFAEVKHLFERLHLYSSQFYVFNHDDWPHLRNKEDFTRIFKLPMKQRGPLDFLYGEGRQLSVDMSYLLQSFNDTSLYPTLKSFVDHIEENCLQHIDHTRKVLTDAEDVVSTLNNCPWAVDQMIELHKRQLKIFESLFNWVNMVKESNLYKLEARHGLPSEIGIDEDMAKSKDRRDVFICHSTEDKPTIIAQLLPELDKKGITYWYDNAEIKWGDSIVRKINEGIRISKYVLVVVSDSFIKKNWPQVEFESAMSIEANSGEIKVLPLMVGDQSQIKALVSKYPILASKLYVKWNNGIDDIIEQLKARLNP